MNVVICKRCGFALGSCVCGKRDAYTFPAYKDDPKLLALLDQKELAEKILQED